MAWTSADLYDRFLLYLGRGNGGVMDADELWTATRVYRQLADAQEAVYTDLAPVAPQAFMSPPIKLYTTDGGRTYKFPPTTSGIATQQVTYPIGHVEVYAQESGGRELLAATFGNPGGDFVIEQGVIRAPGNRVRSYSEGPYARFVQLPLARIDSTTEPTLNPAAARELILFRALMDAANVAAGQMDNGPWIERYRDARDRWVRTWQTQYRSAGNQAFVANGGPWWLGIDAMNGA